MEFQESEHPQLVQKQQQEARVELSDISHHHPLSFSLSVSLFRRRRRRGCRSLLAACCTGNGAAAAAEPQQESTSGSIIVNEFHRARVA